MKKFTKTVKLLLLASLFVGLNANAYYYTHFAIKVQVEDSDTFTVPINPDVSGYHYKIDCHDDGSFDGDYIGNESYTCNYTTAGEYTIVIGYDFPAIYFHNEGDKDKIIDVEQWGTGKWQSMNAAFHGASNLVVTASDNPDLSQTTSLKRMFGGASNLTFTNSINDWNVSNIEYMNYMFYDATSFNQDIGNWDMSKVKVLSGMFSNATSFNQDIGDWDVSSAYHLQSVFSNATSFNQDIGDWNVTGVTNPNLFLYMLHDSNLSISNYDNLLKGWSALDLVNDVVDFRILGSKYCQGEDARDLMMSASDDSWTFNDGGKNCDFYIITPNVVSVKSGETAVVDVNANIGEHEGTSHYIVGGTDGDKFTISLYGELRFITAPDVNNPTDSNGDNIYRVQVITSKDGYTSDYQTIKVQVESDINGALVPTIMYLLN